MTDPATRERLAREDAERRAELVHVTVLAERAARENMEAFARRINYHAGERRVALWTLKELLGTWKKVADATGQNVPAIQKAAYKQPKEGTT